MKTFKSGDTVWVRATYVEPLDTVHKVQTGWKAFMNYLDDDIRADVTEDDVPKGRMQRVVERITGHIVADLEAMRERAEKAEAEIRGLKDKCHTLEHVMLPQQYSRVRELSESVNSFRDGCLWRDEHINALGSKLSQAEAERDALKAKLERVEAVLEKNLANGQWPSLCLEALRKALADPEPTALELLERMRGAVVDGQPDLDDHYEALRKLLEKTEK